MAKWQKLMRDSFVDMYEKLDTELIKAIDSAR